MLPRTWIAVGAPDILARVTTRTARVLAWGIGLLLFVLTLLVLQTVSCSEGGDCPQGRSCGDGSCNTSFGVSLPLGSGWIGLTVAPVVAVIGGVGAWWIMRGRVNAPGGLEQP